MSHEGAIGGGGHAEAGRDGEAGRRHLGEARELAAEQRVSRRALPIQPQNVGIVGHGAALSRTVTVPSLPSTSTRSPVWIVAVAKPTPTTAGSPYSREMIAVWAIMPPTSETAAAMRPKTVAQLGAVIRQTRISPSWMS